MNPVLHKIDFSSSVPYYAQLKELIKSEITDGIWRNEENLPSHSEICDLYDVSKSVVRQALRELEMEGFIVQRRGKLTEIVNKKISGDLLQDLSGTYQNMARMGIHPVTKVLLNEVVTAPISICDRLGLEHGSKVVKLHRLRFVENEPFAFMRSYVPFDLCPKIAEIDLTGKSLLEEIRREYGYEIDSSRRSIEAVLANEDEARLLEVPIGSALLLYKSVSYLKNGRGIGSTKVLFRGDRTKFEVEIGNFRD